MNTDKKGATRKVAEVPKTQKCFDKQHNPPDMIVLEPGRYEHTCPGCGHVQTLNVPEVTMQFETITEEQQEKERNKAYKFFEANEEPQR
jgi:hypothetical protein